MVTARKVVDELGNAVRSPAGYSRLERKRGHLQTCNPTLGMSVQGSDLGACKVQPHCLVEERRCLLEGKAQIALANLGDLAASAQPGKRKGRVLARGDDQVHLRWLSFQ